MKLTKPTLFRKSLLLRWLVLVLVCGMYSHFAWSQTTIIVTIVGNEIVYHSLPDGKVKYIPLDSDIFTQEKPRSIDYNPDNCVFYVITNFRSSPNLYTVTHDGTINLVGALATNDGTPFYSCEAIAYSEFDQQTYISVSFPNRDYYTETIAVLNVNTAVFTPITTVNTSLQLPSDVDFMECYGSQIIFSDNNASGPSYTTLYSIDLPILGSNTTPTSLYYSDTYINFQELTVINDKVYVEAGKRLYEVDLLASSKSFDYVEDLYYNGFNGTSTAMTSFNHDVIFDDLFLHNDTFMCSEDSLQIDPSNYAGFMWSDGSTGLKTIQTPGQYSGYVQLGACIFESDTFEVQMQPCDTCKTFINAIDTTALLAGKDSIICRPDSLRIGVPIIPNWNIQWSNGSIEDSIYIKSNGTYFAVYSRGDCQFQTKSITAQFENCGDCGIHIPNAFTPNHNTINEIFRPIFTPECVYDVINFRVYNRWGEKLLDSEYAEWDGKYMNAPVQLGVYFYILTVKFYDDNSVNRFVGNIHLEK